MGKSSGIKLSAWNDFSGSNTYKAKSALKRMINYISAIIPIPRIINDRKAITYNRPIIIIPKTIWITAIYILGIRPIA